MSQAGVSTWEGVGDWSRASPLRLRVAPPYFDVLVYSERDLPLTKGEKDPTYKQDSKSYFNVNYKLSHLGSLFSHVGFEPR